MKASFQQRTFKARTWRPQTLGGGLATFAPATPGKRLFKPRTFLARTFYPADLAGITLAAIDPNGSQGAVEATQAVLPIEAQSSYYPVEARQWSFSQEL